MDERGDAMTERETLQRIVLDLRNSLETAQAMAGDLIDQTTVDLCALENLSKLLNESNICSTIEAGNPCAAMDCGISS